MERLLTAAVTFCLLLGLASIAGHVCASFREPDRKYHTFLKQEKATQEAVDQALESAQAGDGAYVPLSSAARVQIEKMRSLAYDPIKLADAAKLDEELAIIDNCHRDRSDANALNRCERRLSYDIGH